MTRLPTILHALALLALPGAATAQTARQCITTADAEVMFLAAAPAALKSAAGICQGSLPRTAFLLRPDPAFTARMAAASEAAWPRARAAALRFAGPDIAPLLESPSLQPLLATAVGGIITADLQPADCPKVDRLLTLLAPLPSRNIAGIAVTTVQIAQEDAARRGGRQRLQFCP